MKIVDPDYVVRSSSGAYQVLDNSNGMGPVKMPASMINRDKLMDYFFKRYNISMEELKVDDGRADAIIRELEIKKLLNENE